MDLRPRHVARAVQSALADTPVVVLNGARQVGKTTLVRSLTYPGTSQIVTLDETSSREAAGLDPRAFVQRPVDTLILDEAQLQPALFRAIKAEVDRDRRPGRFLLTGSSRLLSAPDMADALVGRVETLELWPFSQGELRHSLDRFVDAVFETPRALLATEGVTRPQLVELLLAGGYPEAVARSPARRSSWFDSYVTTVSHSVIQELANIERLAEVPRLLRLCAARTATELNVTSVGAELGIPARTLDGYLALLARAFLVQLVPSWSTNVSSKVVRRPKLVLIDSGLAANLLGATASQLLRVENSTLGALLETFAVSEIRKQLTWSTERPSMWHFRDRGGAEVDIVLEHPDGRVVGVEVKATSSPRASDFHGLRFLADRLGARFHFGVLLNTAPAATPFGDRLAALPISSLWST